MHIALIGGWSCDSPLVALMEARLAAPVPSKQCDRSTQRGSLSLNPAPCLVGGLEQAGGGRAPMSATSEQHASNPSSCGSIQAFRAWRRPTFGASYERGLGNRLDTQLLQLGATVGETVVP